MESVSGFCAYDSGAHNSWCYGEIRLCLDGDF